MRSRKELFAEKRKQKAKELKAFNRDQFIRKLLRRKGVPVCFQVPEQECFRGYQVYVDQIIPVNNCSVGVVLGCAMCRHSGQGFEQVQCGQTKDLVFKCRVNNQPKFWIIQPNQKVTGRGVYLVERTKAIYDSHGHLLEPATAQMLTMNEGPPLPRIRPRPVAVAPDPFGNVITPQPGNQILFNISVPEQYRANPQNHMMQILALALPTTPDTELHSLLINAYTTNRLTVDFSPVGVLFTIRE